MVVIQRDMAPADGDVYPVAKKPMKLHDRPIVGFDLFYDERQDRLMLISIAMDAVKTWKVSAFDDEVDLSVGSEYKDHRNGVQSYDITRNGQMIVLIDTVNVMHIIQRGPKDEFTGKVLDRGYHELCFGKFLPYEDRIFTLSFSQGFQRFDFSGENLTAIPFSKVKNISAVAFSHDGKFFVVATDHGNIEIFDGHSFMPLQTIDNCHGKRIRVATFSHNDQYLLLGSDDKTLSLHVLLEASAAKVKRYCYHSNYILSASFNEAKESDTFASASADMRVILWETLSGNALHIFQKCYNEEVITCVKFSRDGRYLCSGTANGQIIVHKIAAAAEKSEQAVHDLADIALSDDEQLEIDDDAEKTAAALPDDLSDSDDEYEQQNGHAARADSPSDEAMEVDHERTASPEQLSAPASPDFDDQQYYEEEMQAMPPPASPDGPASPDY